MTVQTNTRIPTIAFQPFMVIPSSVYRNNSRSIFAVAFYTPIILRCIYLIFYLISAMQGG